MLLTLELLALFKCVTRTIKAFSFLSLLWICFWPFNFLRQIETCHCEGNNTFFYLAPGLRWLKCGARLNPGNISWWVLYVTKQTSERLPARRSMTVTKSLNYYPLCCELWSSTVHFVWQLCKYGSHVNRHVKLLHVLVQLLQRSGGTQQSGVGLECFHILRFNHLPGQSLIHVHSCSFVLVSKMFP